MTITPQSLLELLSAPLAAAAQAQCKDPGGARAVLHRLYPPEGKDSQALRTALREAVAAGVICDKGKGDIRYSRLSKPDASTRGFSIDFVWMTGPGINHRHPQGEINLCYAVEGDPRFDGQPEGWVVFPPGSAHVPTVTGGRMLIVYFLPQGAVEWITNGAK